MSALITQTGQLLQQSADLLKNPIVVPALKGVFGLLKGAFSNNKRAQQRLEMVEKLEANEEDIKALTTNIDDLIFDNEELKKQLADAIANVEEKKVEAGITTETTNINVDITNSGDGNNIIAGINKGGDIIIGK